MGDMRSFVALLCSSCVSLPADTSEVFVEPIDDFGAEFSGSAAFNLGVGLTVRFAVQESDNPGFGNGDFIAPDVALSVDPPGSFDATAQVGATELNLRAATLVSVAATAVGAANVELRVDTIEAKDFTQSFAIQAVRVTTVEFEIDNDHTLTDGDTIGLFAGSGVNLRTRYLAGAKLVVGAAQLQTTGSLTAGGGGMNAGPTVGSATVTALATAHVLNVEILDATAIDHLALRNERNVPLTSPIDVNPSGFVLVTVAPFTAADVEILGDGALDPTVAITGNAELVAQRGGDFTFHVSAPGTSQLAFTWNGKTTSLELVRQ